MPKTDRVLCVAYPDADAVNMIGRLPSAMEFVRLVETSRRTCHSTLR